MTYVALLYSIMLGEGRRVVMSDLKAIAAGLGFENPRTLLATGNLIFETENQPVAALESTLEKAFTQAMGKHIDIIIRTAPDWQKMAVANPFPSVAGDQVCLRVMREPLTDVCWQLVQEKAGDAEVRRVDGDLWIAFSGKPSDSRLPGHLTAKKLGAGTVRNWNTVRRISESL
jgi:uncharacterized protein (DUF1697 family)